MNYIAAAQWYNKDSWFTRLVRHLTRWAWKNQVRALPLHLHEKSQINSHQLHEAMAWTETLLTGKFPPHEPTYYVSPERVRPTVPESLDPSKTPKDLFGFHRQTDNTGMPGPGLDEHGMPKQLSQAGAPACPSGIAGCAAADGCKCQIATSQWKTCLSDLEAKAIKDARPEELHINPEELSALFARNFKGWHIAITMSHSQNTIILVRVANGHGGNRDQVRELAEHIHLEAFGK